MLGRWVTSWWLIFMATFKITSEIMAEDNVKNILVEVMCTVTCSWKRNLCDCCSIKEKGKKDVCVCVCSNSTWPRMYHSQWSLKDKPNMTHLTPWGFSTPGFSGQKGPDWSMTHVHKGHSSCGISNVKSDSADGRWLNSWNIYVRHMVEIHKKLGNDLFIFHFYTYWQM